MKRTLSEEKVLKKLNIPDFRYMTKDKVVQFISMIPKMDPEVAKAAIDKFPDFKDIALQMTDVLKDTVDKIFQSEKESQDFFYASCNGMLITLREQLNDKSIDSEERKQIRDNMMQIVQWISEKDSEHKRHQLYLLGTVAAGFAGILGTAASLLGGRITLPMRDNEDDDEEEV